jgi:hypothetical protein
MSEINHAARLREIAEYLGGNYSDIQDELLAAANEIDRLRLPERTTTSFATDDAGSKCIVLWDPDGEASMVWDSRVIWIRHSTTFPQTPNRMLSEKARKWIENAKQIRDEVLE